MFNVRPDLRVPGVDVLPSKHAAEKLRDIINRPTWEGYQKEIIERAKPR